MTSLRPHEDVPAACGREDYLLSLDPRAVAHRDALIAMARHLADVSLVGNPAPVAARMGERIRAPQRGDLVVETSALASSADADTRLRGLGVLLDHRDEPLAAPIGATVVDHAWYVQYGPNPEDVCRWTNCEFIALPLSAG